MPEVLIFCFEERLPGSGRIPHHENVDGILAFNDEAVALVQDLSTAPLQDVQPKRAAPWLTPNCRCKTSEPIPLPWQLALR
jgi:hypothetical protein